MYVTITDYTNTYNFVSFGELSMDTFRSQVNNSSYCSEALPSSSQGVSIKLTWSGFFNGSFSPTVSDSARHTWTSTTEADPILSKAERLYPTPFTRIGADFFLSFQEVRFILTSTFLLELFWVSHDFYRACRAPRCTLTHTYIHTHTLCSPSNLPFKLQFTNNSSCENA